MLFAIVLGFDANGLGRRSLEPAAFRVHCGNNSFQSSDLQSVSQYAPRISSLLEDHDIRVEGSVRPILAFWVMPYKEYRRTITPYDRSKRHRMGRRGDRGDLPQVISWPPESVCSTPLPRPNSVNQTIFVDITAHPLIELSM